MDAVPQRDDPTVLRAELERLRAELAEVRARAAALEAFAHEDPLTGSLNRRGFERDLARAIAYRARYGTPVALILIDLDRLKPINDRHGHTAGDRALAHVATLLRNNIRASDTSARIGGDEFALLIWQIEEARARQKALALQSLMTASPLQAAGAPIAVEASIGLAMLEPGDTCESVLTRADRALYADKAERRVLRR